MPHTDAALLIVGLSDDAGSCAVCRDPLEHSPAGPALSQCIACLAIVHRDCWIEADRCPAYGCGSRDAHRLASLGEGRDRLEEALDAGPDAARAEPKTAGRALTVPCSGCGVQLRYPALPSTLRLRCPRCGRTALMTPCTGCPAQLRLPVLRAVLRVRCPLCKTARVADLRGLV